MRGTGRICSSLPVGVVVCGAWPVNVVVMNCFCFSFFVFLLVKLSEAEHERIGVYGD